MPTGIHLPKVEQVCPSCNKAFWRVGSDKDRKYCSNTCWLQGIEAKTKTVVCKFCGQTSIHRAHKREQLFCSRQCACRWRAQQKKESAHTNGNWSDYREAKVHLLAKHGACQSCGWNLLPQVLELHHVDRNRRNNHESNLRLLCPTCHTVEHFAQNTGQFASNRGRRVGLV